MGDVGHVVDFITERYPDEGVEYHSEGDGVLWVTPPANFRDINLFYAELTALENVVAVDQEVHGNKIRIKIMVKDDPNVVRRVIYEPIQTKSKNTITRRACQCFQGYIGSSAVFFTLFTGLVSFYWRPIVRFIEAAYMLSQDE